jgi:tetratricopeptide (TPR) repeat protein
MLRSNTPHDALIQATISYLVTPEMQSAWWADIDTSVHPSMKPLVEAMKAFAVKDYATARWALEEALTHVSAEREPDLYVIHAIVDAKLVVFEQGADAGMQRLSAEEGLFDKVAPVILMTARWRLGILCVGAGKLAEAFSHLSEAHSIAVSNNWEYDAALLKSELGGVYLETGDPVQAIAHLEEGYHILTRLGDELYTDRLLMNLALAHGGKASACASPLHQDRGCAVESGGYEEAPRQARRSLCDLRRGVAGNGRRCAEYRTSASVDRHRQHPK